MNINYELAKELKDAGFPQKGQGRTMTPFTKKTLDSHSKVEYGEPVYSPTLEELIEACGNIPFNLERPAENRMWQASNKIGGVWWYEEENTPSEAVARLWLALNKK